MYCDSKGAHGNLVCMQDAASSRMRNAAMGNRDLFGSSHPSNYAMRLNEPQTPPSKTIYPGALETVPVPVQVHSRLVIQHPNPYDRVCSWTQALIFVVSSDQTSLRSINK
jgi:hypothetical protein